MVSPDEINMGTLDLENHHQSVFLGPPCRSIGSLSDWVCVLYVAALNNNKTVSAGRDDGVHVYDREHCDRYIDDDGTVASVVSEQLCYPVLSSYSSGLTACYDHSPQLASLTYLQQVR